MDIQKICWKNGRLILSFQKIPGPADVVYLYKSPFGSRMVWSCTVFRLDIHKDRIRGLLNYQLVSILQLLSQRQNFANYSLLCHYYYCRCSDKLQSIVPSDHIFTAKTSHVMFMVENHLHYYHVSLIKSKLYSGSLSF